MAKRLMAKVGEYQKDGQTKGRYVEIGVIMSNANGEYALLSPTVDLGGVLALQNISAQTPRDRIMVSIFDDDNQRGGTSGTRAGHVPQQSPQQHGKSGFDDDIPF